MKPSEIKTLQENILTRYYEHKRPLPRRETQDPYAIHISEVMAQQTQVDRVIPYREKRMHEIPNYQALAKLPKIELLTYRSGLGFNSRALRLQECANVVIEQYSGQLPYDKNQLLALPGIGPYTASAISAFAWNLPEPVIDTNIRRVLIFLLKLSEDISYNELEHIAQQLIPEGKSRDRHNALMDYGATQLTAKKTKIKSLGKQSKFEGSDREVRGRIVKTLTSKKQALEIEKIKEEFPHKDIEKILNGMIAEKIIQKNGTKIEIG